VLYGDIFNELIRLILDDTSYWLCAHPNCGCHHQCQQQGSDNKYTTKEIDVNREQQPPNVKFDIIIVCENGSKM
jgi:hypothetical protein|tara:strand:- start:230 stop:451 length:222 start_codon:yes stop_codon:yes gene_type:complete